MGATTCARRGASVNSRVSPSRTSNHGHLPLVQRFLAPSDFTAPESWRLLNWCQSIGADEFTIDCVVDNDILWPKRWESFEKLIERFFRGEQTRERMSGRTADDLTRATKIWELNDATTVALTRALPGGLLAYDPSDESSFENPVIYRGGQLLLGVLSHEAFGVFRLSDDEARQLGEAGFPSHDSLPRAG
jgi:hypothetical protein